MQISIATVKVIIKSFFKLSNYKYLKISHNQIFYITDKANLNNGEKKTLLIFYMNKKNINIHGT